MADFFIDDEAADDLYSENLSFNRPVEQIPILEADTIYLLMKENIPLSRVSRVEWLLRKLNTYIMFPDCNKSTVSK